MNETQLSGKVIAITGAGGVLGGAMARGLAASGATIALMDRNPSKLESVNQQINGGGGQSASFPCDVLDRKGLEATFSGMIQSLGRVDALINAAGGNRPGATIQPDQEFFNLDLSDLQSVIDLNLMGTILPCLEMSRIMASQGEGSIINVSSMAAQDPLTRVVGYSAAKAGIDNFTRWLAVELASKHGEKLRVNAIAPGFFIGEQNRDLLLKKDGSHTARGQTIIDHTPMKRFGKPEELVGIVRWLCSDESSFVTGTIIPVDGGFSAWRGV
jgi:NAD(P)-dependent dehydrogenase (short-subunit alcohol dehydrogenase family)